MKKLMEQRQPGFIAVVICSRNVVTIIRDNPRARRVSYRGQSTDLPLLIANKTRQWFRDKCVALHYIN